MDTPISYKPELTPNGKLIHSGRFTPDLEEYYFTISDKKFEKFDVLVTTKENGKWSEPKEAFFNSKFKEHGTSFSPDGKYCFFSSTRSINLGSEEDTWHIWRSRKESGKWSKPELVDIPNMRQKLTSHPSIADDGTLYFHGGATDYSQLDIYYSRPKNGVYTDAVKLPKEVNFAKTQNTPFIAHDQSYILFESTPYLYISFRDINGGWSKAKRLNKKINTKNKGNPFITPDGKYLFFAAGEEEWSVYWVDAKDIINPKN